MGEFTAGPVLSRTFKFWGKNLVPFTVLAFICYLPHFLLTYLITTGAVHVSPTMYGFLATVVGSLCTMLAAAAITYGVVQELRGRPASLGQSVSAGLGRIFSVLGTALLTGIAVGVGSLLLIIPGIIVAMALFVAVPSAVIENQGTMRALSRSWELTKGFRGTIFGIAFVVGLVAFAVVGIYNLVGLGSVRSGTLSVVTFSLVSVALSAIVAPLNAVAQAVVYHDLRHAKEGVDVEQLAAVFD